VIEPPLIVTLISDMFMAAPVEAAVRAAGYQLARVERGEELEPEAERELVRGFVGEALSGRGAGFIRRLAEWRPALIIVELSSAAIPWSDWIAAAKSAPATRRIPVIGFGPHTDLELRAQAIDAGCDVVVANSRLLSALPDLIQKHARLVDYAGLEADCAGQPSELALKGIARFNEGAYFEAHEELELAWGAETGPVRELYRGILQVAVAYLQITRCNYRGALKMFLRLRQWLDPLPDECLGVNVAQLRTEALAARAELEALGPDRIAEFDLRLLKPVQINQRDN
jgi:predicted metal-dependent hydrolase